MPKEQKLGITENEENCRPQRAIFTKRWISNVGFEMFNAKTPLSMTISLAIPNPKLTLHNKVATFQAWVR